MSEQSFKLGFIMGLLCPGEKKILPTHKYPLGNLACSTLKFPTNYPHTSTWVEKTFNGLIDIKPQYIWSNGTHIYYSYSSQHYVLNGDTWEVKTWNVGISGDSIWTDGTNTYLSEGTKQYVLNGDTWLPKTWYGLSNFQGFIGDAVWTDGENIYLSINYAGRHEQYVLNGDTWLPKTWNVTDFGYPWSDGENIYAFKMSVFGLGGAYILKGDVWEEITFDWFTPKYTSCIWSDGTHVYYTYTGTGSDDGDSYVFKDGAWVEKIWNGDIMSKIGGIWTDGKHIYFSTSNRSTTYEGYPDYILT